MDLAQDLVQDLARDPEPAQAKVRMARPPPSNLCTATATALLTLALPAAPRRLSLRSSTRAARWRTWRVVEWRSWALRLVWLRCCEAEVFVVGDICSLLCSGVLLFVSCAAVA